MIQYPRGNADSIETVTSDLGDIALGNQAVLMCLKGSVGCGLPELQYPVEFAVLIRAAHFVPFVVHHPFLNNEKTTEIDTAYFPLSGKPCVDKGWEANKNQSVD